MGSKGMAQDEAAAARPTGCIHLRVTVRHVFAQYTVTGVLATTVAIVGATKSMTQRKRNRTDFNRWLRFRVIAQGFTVAACVAGSYIFGQQALRQREIDLAQSKAADVERERERFADAMARAEEMQRIEDAAKQANQRHAHLPTTESPAAIPPSANSSSWTSWWSSKKQ